MTKKQRFMKRYVPKPKINNLPCELKENEGVEFKLTDQQIKALMKGELKLSGDLKCEGTNVKGFDPRYAFQAIKFKHNGKERDVIINDDNTLMLV